MVLRRFAQTVAVLGSLGIIWVGAEYLLQPGVVSRTFGLPTVPQGDDPFMLVKGVRDVVSGLLVLTVLATGHRRVLAAVLLVQSLTPIGDATIVLGHGGSPAVALGVHGATAAALVAGGLALLRSESRADRHRDPARPTHPRPAAPARSGALRRPLGVRADI